MDVNYFLSRGYQVRLLDPGMKRGHRPDAATDPMPGCDVIVVDFHGSYTERFMSRAAQFATNGGGIVTTFLPWRYVHREIKPRFERVNKLLKPFGMAYRQTITRPADYGFTNIQAVPYPP